jgi:heterotetrameric sarcosine oxidase gamma subunit
MLERRSALASAIARGGQAGASGEKRCRLGEVTCWFLAQVASFPSTTAALEEKLEGIIGELPFGCHSIPGETTIFRTGPHQFWIVGKDATLTERLSEAFAPEIGAVTPLSDSRVRIFIEGDCAADVLSKGIPIDFHPSVFKVGRMALTGLHHTPILIHRVGERRFEIYAMRTFALTVWEWFADAALEFGYEVGVEGNA